MIGKSGARRRMGSGDSIPSYCIFIGGKSGYEKGPGTNGVLVKSGRVYMPNQDTVPGQYLEGYPEIMDGLGVASLPRLSAPYSLYSILVFP